MNGGSHRLKLYIAGSSPRSERAIGNMRRICQEALDGTYELVIIDLQQQPELGEEARVFATPALVREGPGPNRRAVGDMSDQQAVLAALGIGPGLPGGREPSK